MARTSCSTSDSNSSRERGSAFAAALSPVSVTEDPVGGAAELQEHVKSDELIGLGVQHELHAALHLQLLIDVVQVDLDRAFAEAEPPRELPVAEAPCHHAHNLDFPRGEDATPRTPTGFPPQQRLEHPARELLLEPLFARVHFSDAFHEELGRELLEHHPAGN